MIIRISKRDVAEILLWGSSYKDVSEEVGVPFEEDEIELMNYLRRRWEGKEDNEFNSKRILSELNRINLEIFEADLQYEEIRNTGHEFPSPTIRERLNNIRGLIKELEKAFVPIPPAPIVDAKASTHREAKLPDKGPGILGD